MPETKRIDLQRLLGFDTVSHDLSGHLDFKNDTVEARLGAKVGAEVLIACELASSTAKAEQTDACELQAAGDRTVMGQ
jgi:hypothetical protein